MNIDYESNKEDYKDYIPCHCELCTNYYRHIIKQHPKIKEYLDTMNVDILKPFELMPIEFEEKREIEHIGCQYVVFGECENNFNKQIDGVKFYKNIDCHPTDQDIIKKHFILDFGPIVLEWN